MSELLAPATANDVLSRTPLRPHDPGPVEEAHDGPVAPAPARRPSARARNPVRIGRIGTDQIRVFIRPVLDDAELLAVTERLEQLLEAGYDTIDVVFEEVSRPVPRLTRDTVVRGDDTGTITDATSR